MTDAGKSPSSRARSGGRVAGRFVWGAAVFVAVGLGVDVGGSVVAPALIEVKTTVIAAPTTATVRRVLVEDGVDVQAGDVLVELDASALDLELAQAEAELGRVQGAVRARKAGVKDQDFELGLRLQADVDKAAVAQATVWATLKQDERELQGVAALVEKNERLVREQLASAEELDALRVRAASLQERITSAQEELQAATRLKETADRRLADWRTRPGHEDALLAPDEAAVLAQQERIKLVQWRRAQLVLRAPAAGRVGSVEVGAGDVVQAGSVVASLIDIVPTEAVAWVGEDAAWRVRVGDTATLRSVDGRGVTLTGVVRALGGGIVELPVRLRQVPGEPAFGRAIHIALAPGGDPPLPGQTFEASFLPSSPTTTTSPAEGR